MAKATAECTCKTCGSTFIVSTRKPNSRDARQFEEWAVENITECDDCRMKRLNAEHAAENAQAAADSAARQWPELSGTEKQIAWATTIRQHLMDDMQAVEEYRPLMEEVKRIYLEQHTSASWWIDNRNWPSIIRRDLTELFKQLQEDPDAHSRQDDAQLTADAQDDAATIAKPEHQTHDGVAAITAADTQVSVVYPKDESFRTIVKQLGYRWDSARSCWYMKIGATTGSASDRAAELGSHLLNAGFAVQIQDPDTLRRAIESDYEPMCQRWISSYRDQFYITWPYEDRYYDQAKRLPGAKWDSPGMLIPTREYDAVLDFAHTYGFRLTKGAQQLVDEMRAVSTTVTPAATKAPTYDEHPTSEILNSSRDIIEDLIEKGE